MNNRHPNFNQADPVALIIFGVTGDLTKRKLLPAIYQLISEELISNPIHIIGFARRAWDTKKMKDILIEGINEYARVKPVDKNIFHTLFKEALKTKKDF